MNFIQQTSRYDHQGKARYYQRTYEYRDRQGAIQWHCDVFGSCISAPTVFVPQDHGRDSFTMTLCIEDSHSASIDPCVLVAVMTLLQVT